MSGPAPDPAARPDEPRPGEGGQAGGVPRSGLRNPVAAVRGLGAGTLVLEVVVLLLAIVPLAKLGRTGAGTGIGVVLVLIAAAAALSALLRYRWAWYCGLVLQLGVAAAGVFHLALLVLGLVFLGVWGYVLSVRRRVLG